MLIFIKELKESCEPSSFSLEQLLISAAKDPHLSPNVLEHVNKHLNDIVSEELSFRRALTDLKVPVRYFGIIHTYIHIHTHMRTHACTHTHTHMYRLNINEYSM